MMLLPNAHLNFNSMFLTIFDGYFFRKVCSVCGHVYSTFSFFILQSSSLSSLQYLGYSAKATFFPPDFDLIWSCIIAFLNGEDLATCASLPNEYYLLKSVIFSAPSNGLSGGRLSMMCSLRIGEYALLPILSAGPKSALNVLGGLSTRGGG